MGWIIGLTGGVGCGKSTVVKVAQEHFHCLAILTDDVSRQQMEPGGEAYLAVTAEFGTGILKEDKSVDRAALAQLVFSDSEKLKKLNSLTHPLVTNYVMDAVKREREQDEYEFLLIETALLIEGGYDRFCDEVWYVYAPEAERRERLKISRGYSDEKIDELFARQQPEAEYRRVATAVIDNSNSVTTDMIFGQMREILEKKQK